MSPDLAFNTAVSFDTNTNWQNYSGETSASQLIQMAGLAVRNFVSAAVGLAVAIALVRGLVRRTASTIGNFWADVTRCTLYLLLPISIVGALFLVWQGVPQTFDGSHAVTTLQGATQTIPLGPIASQEIDQGAGHQRRRLLQRQLGTSVREPQRPDQLPGDVRDPGHPVRADRDLRPLRPDKRQGWALFAAMAGVLLVGAIVIMAGEASPNPLLPGGRQPGAGQHGGQGGPLRRLAGRPVGEP